MPTIQPHDDEDCEMALLWLKTYTPQLAALFSEAVAAGERLRAEGPTWQAKKEWDRAHHALTRAIGDEDFSYAEFGSPR